MKEYNNILNEYFYHLTADYRKRSPEANKAFFEQYLEQRKHTQLTPEDIKVVEKIEEEERQYRPPTFEDIIREKIEKKYK